MYAYLLRRLLVPLVGLAAVLVVFRMQVADQRAADLRLEGALLCILAAWGLVVVALHIRRTRRIALEWRSCRRNDERATRAAIPLMAPVAPQLRRPDNAGASGHSTVKRRGVIR